MDGVLAAAASSFFNDAAPTEIYTRASDSARVVHSMG
jgi:hypothetical protein